MKAIFFIAVFGLIASAVAHVSTFQGVNPLRAFPPVWMLHVLVFVVWFPVVLSCRKTRAACNRKDFWKSITRSAPVWMKALTVGVVAYAFFNFFFVTFVLGEGGVPAELAGKKVIHSHGKVIRELTDAEYERQQAYVVRAFSGHWMLFYAVGMTVLCSQMREDGGRASEGGFRS